MHAWGPVSRSCARAWLSGWAARGPQRPRPRGDVSACLSCSDDEDVAPLSAKFADIYPLSNYEDAEVVASMNGVHGELNGGGENLALKDEVYAQPPHHMMSHPRRCPGFERSVLFWFKKHKLQVTIFVTVFKVSSGKQYQQQFLRS